MRSTITINKDEIGNCLIHVYDRGDFVASFYDCEIKNFCKTSNFYATHLWGRCFPIPLYIDEDTFNKLGETIGWFKKMEDI